MGRTYRVLVNISPLAAKLCDHQKLISPWLTHSRNPRCATPPGASKTVPGVSAMGGRCLPLLSGE